jgi:hypothetical protein
MKHLALSFALLACAGCARQEAAGDTVPVSAAQVRAPAGPGVAVPAVPYARPDLSADPSERAQAYAMREAIAAHDFTAARKLATTRALREMYNEAQHERAARLQASDNKKMPLRNT